MPVPTTSATLRRARETSITRSLLRRSRPNPELSSGGPGRHCPPVGSPQPALRWLSLRTRLGRVTLLRADARNRLAKQGRRALPLGLLSVVRSGHAQQRERHAGSLCPSAAGLGPGRARAAERVLDKELA